MTSALPAPSADALLTGWTWQPVALVAALVLTLAYTRAVRARGGRTPSWPRGRGLAFGAGVALLVWTTCGFPGAYVDSLYWVWTTQQLLLLLVVPYLLMAGRPVVLAGPRTRRALRHPVVRAISHPLVGPALVPLLSVVLFFGPLPGWAIGVTPVGWVEQVLLVAVGAAIVLPLVEPGERTSLAIGLSLAIGSFELVLDAFPGIVLRTRDALATTWFDHRAVHSWTGEALRDQQVAGAVLWAVAELLDLPFLVIVFRQWMKADARDAADVDAVLEAERAARGVQEPADEGVRDDPWWVSDSALRRRLDDPRRQD